MEEAWENWRLTRFFPSGEEEAAFDAGDDAEEEEAPKEAGGDDRLRGTLKRGRVGSGGASLMRTSSNSTSRGWSWKSFMTCMDWWSEEGGRVMMRRYGDGD